MGSSVPGGWRGSACSGGGGGGGGGGDDARSIDLGGGRAKGPGGGRGREGGGESAPRAAGTSTPPSGIPSAASRDRRRRLRSAGSSACAPPLAFARRLRGGGCGGGCGGRVSRRARERFAKQTLGMIGATGPRSGRIPGGRRRATDRRAAPRRDLGPGAIAGRGRRRAPRGAPGSACPAGEKKQKSFALFFRARRGRTIADTVVDPRPEGGGAEPAAPVLRGRAVHRVPDRARRDDPPLGRSMRSERPGDANPAAVSTEPTEG